jgi:phosphohistidine phosphatase
LGTEGVKTIFLLRHAKSAWSDPRLGDHDRPLNRRGERTAEAMAGHIVGLKPHPDVVLCSTALRTRQTLMPVVKKLGPLAPPIALEKDLYLATEDMLLSRLQALPESARSVLLIGHNDGIWHLAERLAGSGPAALREALVQKFPTGALATLRFPDGPWAGLRWGGAKLAGFIKPRELGVT